MIGKLDSVVIATPDITPDVIVSGTVTIGGEISEIFGQSLYPTVTVGNVDVQMSFVTTDSDVLQLVQSTKVTGVTFIFKGVATEISYDTNTLDVTEESDTLTYVLSHGYVSEVVEVAADNQSKTPVQYTVTIKACASGTATATSLTKTFTAV